MAYNIGITIENQIPFTEENYWCPGFLNWIMAEIIANRNWIAYTDEKIESEEGRPFEERKKRKWWLRRLRFIISLKKSIKAKEASY